MERQRSGCTLSSRSTDSNKSIVRIASANQFALAIDEQSKESSICIQDEAMPTMREAQFGKPQRSVPVQAFVSKIPVLS